MSRAPVFESEDMQWCGEHHRAPDQGCLECWRRTAFTWRSSARSQVESKRVGQAWLRYFKGLGPRPESRRGARP